MLMQKVDEFKKRCRKSRKEIKQKKKIKMKQGKYVEAGR